MNLAICKPTRQYLKEWNVGHSLSLIAKYSSSPTSPSSSCDEEKHKDLQCLKAVRIFVLSNHIVKCIILIWFSFYSCNIFAID